MGMHDSAPILVFADYTKLFLLETDASKDGLGAVLSQKEADRQYHPMAYCIRSLTPHENKLSIYSNLSSCHLKWAVTEHFKEYLALSIISSEDGDNNPLMYIMSTPNLDVTGLQWVSALAQFNFELEYQKGHDGNTGCGCT